MQHPNKVSPSVHPSTYSPTKRPRPPHYKADTAPAEKKQRQSIYQDGDGASLPAGDDVASARGNDEVGVGGGDDVNDGICATGRGGPDADGTPTQDHLRH